MLNPDGTKTCYRCTNPLPISNFYKINRKTGDGFSSYCKACSKQAATEWQSNNPEKMLLKWRSDSAKASERRKSGEMSREEKDRYNIWKKNWVADHKEKKKFWAKRYKDNQKESDLSLWRAKTAIQNNRTRCKQLGRVSDFTVSDWKAVMVAFENKCAFCDSTPKFLDLDHLIPIHRGGLNTAGNIIPICRPCNSHKSCSDPHEFCTLMGKNIEELQKKARVREPTLGTSDHGE